MTVYLFYTYLIFLLLFNKKNNKISLANLVSINKNPEIGEFRERVSLELLTKKRSLLYILEDFKKLVAEDKIKSQQIMIKNSQSVIRKYRSMFFLINFLLFIIGVVFSVVINGTVEGGFVLIQWALIFLGMLFSLAMPKYTEKGLEALYHILGFKKYIEEAEKRRLEFQEKENIFFEVLPYAMALGVVKKWTDTFKDLSLENPDWYESSQAFQIASFSTSLNKINSSLVSSSTSPSSGSSGGGSSGGGSGGGGGGSW